MPDISFSQVSHPPPCPSTSPLSLSPRFDRMSTPNHFLTHLFRFVGNCPCEVIGFVHFFERNSSQVGGFDDGYQRYQGLRMGNGMGCKRLVVYYCHDQFCCSCFIFMFILPHCTSVKNDCKLFQNDLESQRHFLHINCILMIFFTHCKAKQSANKRWGNKEEGDNGLKKKRSSQ